MLLENDSNFTPPNLSEYVKESYFNDICLKMRLGKFEVARLILSYIESGKKVPSIQQVKKHMCFNNYPIKDIDLYFDEIKNHFEEIFG